MPSQQEVRWSQLKVGLIVLVSSALLVILLFLITSSAGITLFAHKLTITTYFDNAAGLKEGASVNLAGVTIGTVKSVTIVSDPAHKLAPVQVVMRMDEKYSNRIHKDSLAGLSTVGVLGDTVIDINSLTATGPAVQDGDELKTVEAQNLQDVIKASQGTVESLNQILSKMNAIVDNLQKGNGSVAQLINSPDVANKTKATLDELNKLIATLNTSVSSDRNSVGKFLNDNGDLYNHANNTLAKIDAITADAQSGKGTAGKLLKDDKLYDNANSALAHLNSLLAEADAGKGSIGMLAKDPTFATHLNNTLDKVNDLVTKIDSGQGSLGKLVNDDTTSVNLNNLLTASTDLVTTIRKDPKKYLTIHMRIF